MTEAQLLEGQKLVSGYANGLITDDECTYQVDLLENGITVIDGMIYSSEIDKWVTVEEYIWAHDLLNRMTQNTY